MLGHVTNLVEVSTSTIPLATKYGKVVTYHESFSPMKLHNPLNMWAHDFMWQIKNMLMALQPQYTISELAPPT